MGLIIFFLYSAETSEINTAHFRFKFDKQLDTGAIYKISASLESNFDSITNHLQTKPLKEIEVFIYSNRWNYLKATKNWSGSGNIEGVSKLHFLNEPNTDIEKIAVHEFTHAIVLQLLLNQSKDLSPEAFEKKFAEFPIWLWEAISVYEANQFVSPKTLAYFSTGNYPDLNELNQRLKGAKIYDTGYTIVEFILELYGREKLLYLFKNQGNIQLSFGITEKEFSKNWFEFAKKKYFVD